jgi:hypothetical protein
MLLDRLLQIVDTDQIHSVVTDREFLSFQWLKRL